MKSFSNKIRRCYTCGTVKSINVTTGYPNWYYNRDREANMLCMDCDDKYIQSTRYWTRTAEYRKYYQSTHRQQKKVHDSTYYSKHRLRIRETDKMKYYANIDKSRAKSVEYTRRRRMSALSKIGKGKIECVRCGCNRVDVIEINHINGGGGREKAERAYALLLGDIIAGRRTVDDLELLCKPCNAIHCLEMKYGKMPFILKWDVSAVS